MSADTARLSSEHNKLGKPGGPGLFGDTSMQLPAYIQNIAKALMRDGKTKSQAIQIAIGTVKRWASGGGGVTPEVRAAAAKAVAEWEAAKAKARATPNKGSGASLSNPLAHVGMLVQFAGDAPDVSTKGMIALEVPEGTIEPVPGGLAADEMHVTLQYLGDDVSDQDFAKAIRGALSAADSGPVSGWVGGLGVFPAKDGKVAVWCPVDVPGVARLHDYVSGGSRPSGEDAHGFTPHITLRWGTEGQKLPAPVPRTPVTFTHILVKRGDQTFRLPLGGDRYDTERAYANARRVAIDLSRPAEGGGAPPKKAPPKPRAGVGKDGGPARFKHGWIPVDQNGKQTGPAQMPAWLKADHAKHAAAGGKTAQQITQDAAKAEFAARAKKAAAPAKKAAAAKLAADKHAAADAKKVQAARLSQAKADNTQKAAAARHAAALKKAKDKAAAKKVKDRDALINKAYKQALADEKAGRTLSPQQQRVMSYMDAKNAKETASLRGVDVKGQKVTHKAPVPTKKSTTTAPATSGSVTSQTTTTGPKPVKFRSFKRQTHLSNDTADDLTHGAADVNGMVLEFAGSRMPGGQLAFRYKHGWILINPAIPSRGKGAGGLAKSHGHVSGTVTHGHFEPHPSGKGKVFVADRTGGKTASQKAAEAAQKKQPAVVNGKVNYTKIDKNKLGLAASKNAASGNALNPSKPTPEAAKEKSIAAAKQSLVAQKSHTVPDAEKAAKLHAEAFVANNKLGKDAQATMHKNLAQDWQKKAVQMKKAEKSSAKLKEDDGAKKAAEEKQAAADADYKKAVANALKASTEANANPTSANHYKAQDAHNEAANAAETAKNDTAVKSHEWAADVHGEQADKAAKKEFEAKKAADAKKKAAAEKVAEAEKLVADASAKLMEDSNHADALTKTANKSNTQAAHAAAAKAHTDAAKQASALGKPGLKAHHTDMAAVHDLAAAGHPNAPANSSTMSLNDAIGEMMDNDFDESVAPAWMWDDYLNATAQYKLNPGPATLKKLTAAQKALTSEGVVQPEILAANKKLMKLTGGMKTGVAKKTAAKKTAPPKTTTKITSTGKKTVNIITAHPISAPPVAPVPVGPINLPGPGMYADGKAIKAAEDKLAGMDSSNPEYAGLSGAITEAKISFKSKHGVNYAGTKAGKEVGYTGGYGGGYDAGVTDSFFDDAKAAGYTTVAASTSANGSWKPADVPGLASNSGAYHYSGGSYSKINAQLRKYKSPTGGANDKAIAQMDKEFAAVPPLDHGIVTVRQMSTDGPFPGYPPPMDAGAEFVDHGYSSTSKKTGTWSGQVIMEVRIPKGGKVLDLNHTTKSQHSGEQEILLNRGTKYRIVSDAKSGDNRKIVVEVVV